MKRSDDVLEIVGPAALFLCAIEILHNPNAPPVARQIAKDIEQDDIDGVTTYVLGGR